jgi:hypothetical protein
MRNAAFADLRRLVHFESGESGDALLESGDVLPNFAIT